MKKITYITDPAVLAIPIVESKELMIDLRAQDEIAFGPVPECSATKHDYTKMRETVYEKLCNAQKDLPNNFRFRLYEGYRSLKVQQWLFENEYERVKNRLSGAAEEKIFNEVTRLVSPVINFDGSKNIPAHNTGAAVDVELIDHKGRLVNMGMAVADTWQVDPGLCLTNAAGLDVDAKKNRKMLFEIMIAHGFINYPTEWWHYSFGDRYWAHQSKKAHAIYDSADLIV